MIFEDSRPFRFHCICFAFERCRDIQRNLVVAGVKQCGNIKPVGLCKPDACRNTVDEQFDRFAGVCDRQDRLFAAGTVTSVS